LVARVISICSTAFVVGVLAEPVLATTSGAQSKESQVWVAFPNGTKVSVEVADTDGARARGLMFRETLAPDRGMLFLFEKPGLHPFWMKNTLISLDILWLDGSGAIVSIAHAVPPCTGERCPYYSPDKEACAVVEVTSGFTKHHHVNVGDTVKFQGLAKPSPWC
jgi:uncharacterized membrane protein (UPF0127 family)